METDNGGGLDLAAVLSGAGADAEAHGHISHGVEDNTLVLRGVFRDTTKVSLENVVAVEIRHFTGRLNPHLVLRELSKIIKGSDMNAELLCVSELADASTEGNEMLTRNTSGNLQNILREVINTVFLDTENIVTIFTLNKELKVTSNTVERK